MVWRARWETFAFSVDCLFMWYQSIGVYSTVLRMWSSDFLLSLGPNVSCFRCRCAITLHVSWNFRSALNQRRGQIKSSINIWHYFFPVLVHSFFVRMYIFHAEAEYSYLAAEFRLKIFLIHSYITEYSCNWSRLASQCLFADIRDFARRRD